MYDVCVVGGAGHVGAPLAGVLASRGFRTLIYDINLGSPFDPGWAGFRSRRGRAKSCCAGAAGRYRPGFVTQGGRRNMPHADPHDRNADRRVPKPHLRSRNRMYRRSVAVYQRSKTLILRSTVSPGRTEHVPAVPHPARIEGEGGVLSGTVVQGRTRCGDPTHAAAGQRHLARGRGHRRQDVRAIAPRSCGWTRTRRSSRSCSPTRTATSSLPPGTSSS